MNEKNNVFKTKDLYLASFLKARGIKLLKVEKFGSIATFHFENKDGMEKIITGFFNNKELVNANRLIGSIRDLKSLVHNI